MKTKCKTHFCCRITTLRTVPLENLSLPSAILKPRQRLNSLHTITTDGQKAKSYFVRRKGTVAMEMEVNNNNKELFLFTSTFNFESLFFLFPCILKTGPDSLKILLCEAPPKAAVSFCPESNHSSAPPLNADLH